MASKASSIQLKTKYGIDVTEDQPPCNVHTPYSALTGMLVGPLANSITYRLYPEARHATDVRRRIDQ